MEQEADQQQSVAENVGDAVDNVAASRPLAWWARLGLVARGLIYLLMGLLGLVLAGGASAEVDQKGALHAIITKPFGGVVVGLIALGFLGYAVWRFAEAATGAVVDGDAPAARFKSLGRGIVYTVLAFTAVSVLIGSRSTQAGQQRSIVGQVLDLTGGRFLVALAGLVVLGIGIALAIEGLDRSFLRYLDHAELPARARRAARWLGTVGSVARGVVIALVGAVLVLAALRGDESGATGIDGALKALLGLPGGTVLLIAASLGLVAFGAYGLLEARYRRVGTAGGEAARR